MYISDSLYTMLNPIRHRNPVAHAMYYRLYSYESTAGDYFDYVMGKGMISFLPKARIARVMESGDYYNIYTVAGRQETRVGRAVRMMFDSVPDLSFTDSEIEQFTNLLRAQDVSLSGEFALVEGEAIRHWYNGRRYAPRQGSLNSSCMRYARTNKYLGIYVNNPDVVKLLIMTDKETNKLLGRALVWFTDEGTFMDRVYGSDLTIAAFRNYATEKGWYVQNGYDGWIYNGERVIKTFRIELSEWEFDSYPYMDTVAYLDFENGIISNADFDRTTTKYLVMMNSTEGRYHYGLNALATCGKCSRFKRPDCGCAYCDYCPTCATMLPSNGVCQSCCECRSCGAKDIAYNMIRMSSGWECKTCNTNRLTRTQTPFLSYSYAPTVAYA